MSGIVLNSRWILRAALYCLIAFSSMFALTCRMSRTEELREKDKKTVSSDESLADSTLHLLRNAAINNIGQLSNEEKKHILETVPQVSRYKMAGEFGQYGWRWDLPTGRTVMVSFTGILKNIDANRLQTAVFVTKK